MNATQVPSVPARWVMDLYASVRDRDGEDLVTATGADIEAVRATIVGAPAIVDRALSGFGIADLDATMVAAERYGPGDCWRDGDTFRTYALRWADKVLAGTNPQLSPDCWQRYVVPSRELGNLTAHPGDHVLIVNPGLFYEDTWVAVLYVADSPGTIVGWVAASGVF